MKDNKDEPFSEEMRLYDRYGYLDKVLAVTEGKNRITYGYHVDGQLATVTKGRGTEEFTWDGLALVKRGSTSYMNEPQCQISIRFGYHILVVRNKIALGM